MQKTPVFKPQLATFAISIHLTYRWSSAPLQKLLTQFCSTGASLSVNVCNPVQFCRNSSPISIKIVYNFWTFPPTTRHEICFGCPAVIPHSSKTLFLRDDKKHYSAVTPWEWNVRNEILFVTNPLTSWGSAQLCNRWCMSHTFVVSSHCRQFPSMSETLIMRPGAHHAHACSWASWWASATAVTSKTTRCVTRRTLTFLSNYDTCSQKRRNAWQAALVGMFGRLTVLTLSALPSGEDVSWTCEGPWKTLYLCRFHLIMYL